MNNSEQHRLECLARWVVQQELLRPGYARRFFDRYRGPEGVRVREIAREYWCKRVQRGAGLAAAREVLK